MSDAGIERAYEQDLQAAARYLEVWVTYEDGRRIKRRTFMDTPEGRQSAAKNADTWMELPLVTSVEVVPVGGSSGTGSRDPEWARPTGGEAGAHQPKPQGDPAKRAPTSTTCQAGARRCVPEVYVGPSGKRRRHAWDCPDMPGEPIHIAREHARGRQWPPRGRVRG